MNNINVILNIPYKKDEPLSLHTGFRTGGNADYMLFPESKEQLINTIKILRTEELPFFVLGNGSNILATDVGYRGFVIKTAMALDYLEFSDGKVRCGAGKQLSFLCSECARQGLSGLEFAFGIPGTVGGAVFMNAGAYGGEMKDVVHSVTVLDKSGDIFELSNDQMNFKYRSSIAQSGEYVILDAEFSLSHKDRETIQSNMNELMQRRRDKQPLDMPSCGSTFKRPPGAFASKLIDECGLRGFSVGGAQVSEKHCGFVVNKGGASSDDILSLVEQIQTTVKQKTGFELECEIRILK
ncbi:MAG: UDP-N-acetylmuramate dehydrogenase [Oscillospiraceae bacterium]